MDKVFEVNTCGVCINPNLHDVYRTRKGYLEIKTARLGGKWHFTTDGCYGNGGWGGGVQERFSEPFETETDALINAIRCVKDHPEMKKLDGWDAAIHKFYETLTEPTLF